jgi:c-di-GMP-binding flagellar brake protein YcgR
MEKRQYVRVSVQFRSHFSPKSPIVAGDGLLLDLSPGGCRVTSPIAVPPGVELEFCIFPGDEGNPFIIESAKVCWARNQEFGLAFTQIRPEVQTQLTQPWRKRTLTG